MAFTRGELIIGLFYIAAGIMHFINTNFYLRMMPAYLPAHLALVYLSGLAEIAAGGAMLFPAVRPWAPWAIIALLLAVLPANVQMALNPQDWPNINPVLLWLRLPLQGVLIWWAARFLK